MSARLLFTHGLLPQPRLGILRCACRARKASPCRHRTVFVGPRSDAAIYRVGENAARDCRAECREWWPEPWWSRRQRRRGVSRVLEGPRSKSNKAPLERVCAWVPPTAPVIPQSERGSDDIRRTIPTLRDQHLCRDDVGLRKLAFSLYKEENGDGISAENMIRLIYDLHELVGGGRIKGAQSKKKKAETIIRDRSEWDERTNESARPAYRFSWEEFDRIVRAKRSIIGNMYGMQLSIQKSLGGVSMWRSTARRVGKIYSGMLKETRWKPRRQLTFGEELADTRQRGDRFKTEGLLIWALVHALGTENAYLSNRHKSSGRKTIRPRSSLGLPQNLSSIFGLVEIEDGHVPAMREKRQ